MGFPRVLGFSMSIMLKISFLDTQCLILKTEKLLLGVSCPRQLFCLHFYAIIIIFQDTEHVGWTDSLSKSVESKSELALHFWNPINLLLCGRLAKLIDLKLMFLLHLLAVSTLLSVSLCLKLHKIL